MQSYLSIFCAALALTSVCSAAEPERLVIPATAPVETVHPGLQRLGGMHGGMLYVPASYRPSQPLPLLVLLHHSGGTSGAWFSGGHKELPASFSALAESHHFIILAPDSPGNTWGAGTRSFGTDAAQINRTLEAAFRKCAIDRHRLALGGFSDGASYALSLTIANGDLFPQVIAFSPGFFIGKPRRGNPRIFISHGGADNVLPIEETSGRFVPALRKAGYTVEFDQFDGGHEAPLAVVNHAMSWLEAGFHSGRSSRE